MTEPSLFDAAAAERARDQAVDRAQANADEAWSATALACVWAVAATQAVLTTDDVETLLARQAVSTHEPRALGAVMRQAQREGVVAATSQWQLSDNPRCHRRPKRVWRSLLWGQAR